MFSIFDRYLGRQALFSTLFGVGVLSLVLVLGNIFKKVFPMLEQSEVPLIYLGKFIAYVLPFSLAFTIPWGFLTAVLLIYGRLSADNELISMRMAGWSMPRICAPILIIAVALSGLCLFINVSVSPRSKAAIKQLLYELAQDNPDSLFAADQVKELPGFVFYTGDKEDNVLHNLHLVEVDGTRPMNFILAREVQVDPKEGEDAFTMEFRDYLMEMRDTDRPDDLSLIRHGVQLGIMSRDISLAELKEKTKRNKPNTKTTAALGQEIKTGVDTYTGEKFDESHLSVLKTEVSRRYSFSMACITFALIGIPLGVTAQRRETSIGFALSFVIACVYFLLVIGADVFRDKPEAYPHLLMWLPNVFFLVLGVILFWRVSRR